MELELRNIRIKDIAFGEKTVVNEGVLTIDKETLIHLLLEDPRILSVSVDLARPGESIRIVPVKDVIEPRAKRDKTCFPGIAGAIDEIGTGITYVLKGCAVVTTGPIVGFQEGIIDMSGPLTKYTPFAHLNNIVLHIDKAQGVAQHDHEEAVRQAGIKAARYLAEQALDYPDYAAEVFRWESLSNQAGLYPELPKMVYVYQCMSQGLLHDTYVYGRDSKKITPLLISPLDVMDGAIVSGNCVSPGSKTTTFHHQNNAVIRECFLRHGTELNFIGVVLCPLMTTLQEKIRNTMLAAKLVEMLGAEGVVISQEGFGNPTTDLMMNCRRLEEKGIKTVLISNEDAGVDGRSEPLPDGVACADAIISTGNSNATIELPPMAKVLGDLNAIERITGGFSGSIRADGSLLIEIHGILGSHNLQGYGYLSAGTV